MSGPAADASLRALVIAAHADDDAVGFGIGLRERGAAAIVYLTDSAPRDPRFFTTPSPSRQLYAAARRAETLQAAAMLGVAQRSLFFLDAVDMEAYCELARLDSELSTLATIVSPRIIWSPAYDGGHPDHDVAAFLAARLAGRLAIPHCEFALYPAGRRLTPLRFSGPDQGSARHLTAGEQDFKRALLAVYASQRSLLSRVDCTCERYRVAHRYDFRRRPVAGATLYESWGWPVTADMLLAAFGAVE